MDDVERYLSAGERVRLEARPHAMALARPLLQRAAQVAALVLIARAVRSPLVDQALGADFLREVAPLWLFAVPGIVLKVCFLLAVAAVAAAAFDFLRWRSTRFVVTEQRVLAVRGVLGRSCLDSPLDRIDDVLLEQGPLGLKLDYGDLFILRSSDEATRVLRALAEPLLFKQAMEAARVARLARPVRPAGPRAAAAAATAERDVRQTLRELVEQREKGILSPDEFETRKRGLLGR